MSQRLRRGGLLGSGPVETLIGDRGPEVVIQITGSISAQEVADQIRAALARYDDPAD